jgi:hypothetical protein
MERSNEAKMKSAAFTLAVFTLISTLSPLPASAQKTPPSATPIAAEAPISQKFLDLFAKNLDAELKGKSVGYSFYITAKNGRGAGGAGGDARRAPDASPRKETFDDKFNVASVSKTITAAAILKLMSVKKIGVDAKISSYLPKDWVRGPNVDLITFRQLLTHRAGIRCQMEVTFANLRTCIAAGVKAEDMPVYKYANTNFALFRLILPIMNGFDSASVQTDAAAAAEYAKRYITYVRSEIFSKAKISGMDCQPVTLTPALSYQYPSPILAGESFGNMTETCGSRGWNISAKQLSTLMFNLFYTDRVVPASVATAMKDGQLGLFLDNKTIPGISAFEHGGYYPGKDKQGNPFNNGEMNSYVVTFSNGLNVAVIVNSQFGPGLSVGGAVKTALKQALGL